MNNIFFTSDTHFGHKNIIKYCHRPFLADVDREALDREGVWHTGNWKGAGASQWQISEESVEIMNNGLIDNINSVVGVDDILWHLGDWALEPAGRYYQKCREYRDRIKCKNIYLIWGNHDNKIIRDLFSNTFNVHELVIGEQMIVLDHYAKAVWNKSHRGSWHLYGHSHTGSEAWLDTHMPGRRSMDVGIDNAYGLKGQFCPFSLDEIKAIMQTRCGFGMNYRVDNTAPSEEDLLVSH